MKFTSSENVDVKKNVIIFIIIALILFFIDRSENKYFKIIRFSINDAIIYSTVIVKSPFNFAIKISNSITNFFHSKNIINQNEILELKNEINKIKNENISLRLQLDNFKKIINEENYQFQTIRTKVLMYKSNILQETIIINKGEKDGVNVGDPLIKNNVLVGKVIKTNFKSSHGILITNINSRVPVKIGDKSYRAIVVGNPNTEKRLNLEFLPKEFSFNDGDYIYTTNINNVMPEGILVGRMILKDKNNFFASPLYDFNQMDYLTIITMKR